jgi:hypothetical protein
MNMQDQGSRGAVRGAGRALLEGGPAMLALRARRFLRERTDRLGVKLLYYGGGLSTVRRYVNVRRRLQPDALTDADPFKLLAVDPCRIEWREQETPRRWGRLEDGNWDTRTNRVDETVKYRSIAMHVEDDVPWEETPEWAAYVERLENGMQPKGCETRADLRARFEAIDDLYERIASNGYRSQRDLWAEDPERQRESFYKQGRVVDPRTDEVTVTIGCDGTLFHRGRGDHRLVIAQLLELETIPVLVRARHVGWQQRRDAIRTAGSVDRLDSGTRALLGHPDLRDCRADLEGGGSTAAGGTT